MNTPELEQAKLLTKLENGQLADAKGKPLVEIDSPGYFQMENHFYHVRKSGDVLHVNNAFGSVINRLRILRVDEEDEHKLKTISKEIFENELHNAIIDLSLGKYFKS